MVKLIIINGPNLNLTGLREPDVYGSRSYEDIMGEALGFAKEQGAELEIIQSNSEGGIIDAIHKASLYDGIIINPGAYTHYSYAIHDAIKAVSADAIEVHLSNIAAREDFRKASVTAAACVGQISGLGAWGYILAIQYFINIK